MSSHRITKLLKAESPFFSVAALQAMFNLTRESARTTAARLAKRGILVRLQRDLYALANRKYSIPPFYCSGGCPLFPSSSRF